MKKLFFIILTFVFSLAFQGILFMSFNTKQDLSSFHYEIEELPTFSKSSYSIKQGETIFLSLQSKAKNARYEASIKEIQIVKISETGCYISCNGFFESGFVRVFLEDYEDVQDKTYLTYKNEILEFQNVRFHPLYQDEEIKIEENVYGIYSSKYELSFYILWQFPTLPMESESINALHAELNSFFKSSFYWTYHKDRFYEYQVDIDVDNFFLDASFAHLKLQIDQGVLELNFQKVSLT